MTAKISPVPSLHRLCPPLSLPLLSQFRSGSGSSLRAQQQRRRRQRTSRLPVPKHTESNEREFPNRVVVCSGNSALGCESTRLISQAFETRFLFAFSERSAPESLKMREEQIWDSSVVVLGLSLCRSIAAFPVESFRSLDAELESRYHRRLLL